MLTYACESDGRGDGIGEEVLDDEICADVWYADVF
jgi:hypothetical protein